MVTYDEGVIEKYAERLYRQADDLVRLYTAGAALLGLAPGFAMVLASDRQNGEVSFLVMIVLGGFAGLIGCALGESRAAGLRLQAQTALCQVQIEKHTRPR